MSSESRNMRLANDYQELCNMRGEVLDWKVLRGTPPHVDQYELNINIKSPISKSLDFRNTHVVRVTLPPSYPKDAPTMVMVSKPKIAHPNWWRDGLWCEGDSYSFRESLGTLVRRMLATIQFDPDFAKHDSTADGAVLAWYKEQLNKGMLPFDRSVLPDPKGNKEIVKKRTFRIKR